MVQQPAHSIIAELEDAVRGGSSARRVETLRQVTDLFLNDGERLSDDQVKVFDEVLCLLIARVETRAKAELSKRLAPLDYAPFEVIQHLAWDDEIEVAGNVLANSSRLGTEVLVEIASSKGQDHLLAISGRPNLPAAVTDVIVDRGEGQVIRKLANNAGAQFSEEGYSNIVARASADDELVEILGLRGDLPDRPHVIRQVRDAANHAVQFGARSTSWGRKRLQPLLHDIPQPLANLRPLTLIHGRRLPGLLPRGVTEWIAALRGPSIHERESVVKMLGVRGNRCAAFHGPRRLRGRECVEGPQETRVPGVEDERAARCGRTIDQFGEELRQGWTDVLSVDHDFLFSPMR